MGLLNALAVGNKKIILSIALIAALLAGAIMPSVSAQQQSSQEGFALQVTPSPLVATVKPGQTTTLELTIRNTNSKPQKLKMGTRSFSVDEATGQVKLGTSEPDDVKDFVTFSSPSFQIEPGAIFTQKITIAVPQSAGFSYSFAVIIAREETAKQQSSSATIKGSVAVFTLLNVDRAGSKRKFELSEFSSGRHLYEYLPASFSIKLKNTGNTLVQPQGNIFIQRHSDDAKPITAISLNESNGYILPNTSRDFKADWNEGFPHYETVDADNGTTSRNLVWDWGKLSQIRIGKYTAKAVSVYDDGQRDVPVVAEFTFWVIPWRILLITTLVVAVLGVGIFTILRKTTKAVKHKLPNREPKT